MTLAWDAIEWCDMVSRSSMSGVNTMMTAHMQQDDLTAAVTPPSVPHAHTPPSPRAHNQGPGSQSRIPSHTVSDLPHSAIGVV
jgi:hypothetical protein